MPKLGTLGGFREKRPEIYGCGSCRCGKDQLKLKKPLMFSMALCTLFFAPSMRLEIPFLIPSKVERTLFFASTTVLLTEEKRLIQKLRKPSHLFHSSTNAAISPPIATTTTPMGFATKSPHMAERMGIRVLLISGTTVPVISGTTVPPTKPTRLPTPVVMVPTAVITLPIITRAGPIAATIRPMVTMACFWPSSIPSSFSFAFRIYSASF